MIFHVNIYHRNNQSENERMMNNLGTIYVLINPVMQGLVKIGKTKRQVGERIQELSSATGVPTQFILVYEQRFVNVDIAETQIHLILEEKGYRLSSNREFFNIPVTEAIKVIQSLDGQYDGEIPNNEDVIDIDTSTEGDEFGGLTSSKQTIESQPWAEFWYMAENYYYGHHGEIQDYNEAISYYSKAIKAGCQIAYIRMGEMFEAGEGVSRADATRALEFYKKGANVGDYYCYIKMAKLYLGDGNAENAQKCIDRFVKNRINNQKDFIEEDRDVGRTISSICEMAIENDIISIDSKRYLSSFKDEGALAVERSIQFGLENQERFGEAFVISYTEKLEKVKAYILSL